MRTTGTRRAQDADAKRNASSRCTSRRASGAHGHPMNHVAGDAARCSLRDGPARGCGLRFEIDHGSCGDLGDYRNTLGAEDGRKDLDRMRADREHSLGAGEESLHGGHGLVLGGRVLYGGQSGLDVEGQRWEHIADRRNRSGSHTWRSNAEPRLVEGNGHGRLSLQRN
jgi:hypothetical protein